MPQGLKLAYIPQVILCTCLLTACSDPEPIKIGLSAGLSGSVGDLGRSARDGVMLHLEEVNASGGIHGRKLELIIRDDGQNSEQVLKADKELMDENVAVIIGHITSSMSVAAVPQINANNMLLFSPSTATNSLSDLDDNFLRSYEPVKEQSFLIATHASEILQANQSVIVADFKNKAFTEDWAQHYQQKFEELGGEVSDIVTYVTGTDVSFINLAREVLEHKNDSIVILANGMDTAKLSHQLKKIGSDVPILTSTWSASNDLIKQGGASVEGLISGSSFDKNSTDATYVDFVRRFDERFHQVPNSVASHSYEAVQIIVQALSSLNKNDLNASDLPMRLKSKILEMKSFRGLQGEIEFNQYGDVEREQFLIRVKNGQYETVQLHEN